MSEQNKKPDIVAGVVILMIASLFEKIVGVFLKIPLYDLLGNTGMGYFNSAYSIFSTFYTISLTGFPVGVSLMVSESMAQGRLKQVRRISGIALVVFSLIGLVLSSFMFFGSGLLANVIDSEHNSSLCIKCIAPILLIICISSAMKGYYQGRKNMVPTAVSEFLDAFGKCVLGITFAIYAVKQGYSIEICSAYAIAGVTCGHLLGLLFLTVYRLVSKKPYADQPVDECEKRSKLVKTLFIIAIPITFSSMALGLTSNIDTFTIMNCIHSEDAMAQYGDYSTLALTLFRLPQGFIVPIASALTPTLTGAIAGNEIEKSYKIMHSSIKMTSIVAFPCAMGLSVLSYPIIYLLFGKPGTEASVAVSAPCLSIIAIGVIFMALLTVTSSILQAHKLEKLPVISTFIGAGVKFGLNILLISLFGIIGAPISSLAGYMTMAIINIVFVKTKVYKGISFWKACGKPLISSLIMAAATAGLALLFNTILGPENIKLTAIIVIILSIAVYLALIFITKSIDREDLMLMKKGEKVCRYLEKLHLIK